MTYMHSFRTVAATLLALILALGLVAGTVAQSGGAAVTIIRVESQAFPQVAVSLAISDENGPRDGLTAADFRVFEDGVEVPATSILVQRDASQGGYLVLALDLSMNAASLTELKEAATAFIDSLGPRDRVAVIAFYDQVEIVRDFTNNKDVLRAAIEDLTPEGNYTAFNDAAFVAASIAGAYPTGRKAVVMLTNSADNISDHTVDEVVDKARSASVPIYVVGFDRVAPDVLRVTTTSTGGASFILADLNEVQDSFQAIGEHLRRGGYKVIFQSGLKADNAEHDMVIGVSYQGTEGKAEGRFAAVPGQVIVSLPDLAEGQWVEGRVNLAVQATAPAPIVSVEYRLNDRSLVEVSEPPYNFEWDSTTLEPGTYRLSARAVDRAGNEGQAEVNLDVIRPVMVTASTSRTEMEVGDQVAVTATIEALAEVVRVEFLLDGESIGSVDAPPYRFSFDSNAYSAGEHRVTVRAEDSLGRQGESSQTVQFLAPSALDLESQWRKLRARPRLLTLGEGIAGTLAGGVVAVLGLVTLVRVQKRGRQTVYRLEISNQGNVYSRYELRAEDPVDALKFQFSLNGVKLPPRAVPETAEVVTEAVPDMAVAPPAASVSSTGPGGGGVQPALGQTRRAAGAMAGIASSIGAVLPGSVGAPARRVGSQLRQGQSQAGRAARLPQRVAKARPVASPVPVAPAQAAARVTARPTRAPAGRPRAAPATWAPQSQRDAFLPVQETWVETPFVAPGETLRLDLLMAALKPYQAQHYSFKVMSRSLEREDLPLVVEQGSVQIRGTSWFRRLVPTLVFAVFLVIVALAVISFWGFLGISVIDWPVW